MLYRQFGRTGLKVSTVGVGTGGASRLGLSYGSTEDDAIAVVHRALELGINYFDTAEHYANEHVLGRALEGRRDEVVLSTKTGPVRDDGSFVSPDDLRVAVEASLAKLRTDYVDVFHLHRVSTRSYAYARDVLVPTMVALRDEGKLRYLAVSESSGTDVGHDMLAAAVADGCFDVVMVSFNLFNQSARERVFPGTIARDIAVEIMASARSQFSRPDLLAAEVERLVATGELAAEVAGDDPLGFLRGDDGAIGIAEASYRFAAYEPGVHTVLVGTGKIDHLEQNVAAFERGPLPADVHDRIVTLFGHLREEVHVPGRAHGPS